LGGAAHSESRRNPKFSTAEILNVYGINRSIGFSPQNCLHTTETNQQRRTDSGASDAWRSNGLQAAAAIAHTRTGNAIMYPYMYPSKANLFGSHGFTGTLQSPSGHQHREKGLAKARPFFRLEESGGLFLSFFQNNQGNQLFILAAPGPTRHRLA